MTEKAAHIIKKIALVLFYITIYFVLMFALTIEVGILEEDAENYSGVVTILASLAALGIYYVMFYLRKIKPRRYIRYKRISVLEVALSFAMAIGFRLLTGAYFVWAENIPVIQKSIENAEHSYNFNTMTDFGVITIVLSICIAAPVFEEVLFRGLVQKELSDAMPVWAAIIIQGLLFGFAHGVLAQSIFAAVYGMLLGLIYYKSRNIGIVMLSHMFFNISSALEVKNGDTLMQMFFTGLALTVASIYLFFHIYKRKQIPVTDGTVGGSNNGNV